jgi:hypothetical protein
MQVLGPWGKKKDSHFAYVQIESGVDPEEKLPGVTIQVRQIFYLYLGVSHNIIRQKLTKKVIFTRCHVHPGSIT